MGRLQAYQHVTGQPQFWLSHLEIPQPEDFERPGHVFPLKYRLGGVLKRVGHTEAFVDLAVLSGSEPVAVFCELTGDDGPMARLPKLREFAQQEILETVSIADPMQIYLRSRSSQSDPNVGFNFQFLSIGFFCQDVVPAASLL